ncbi:Nuclear transcription factor Y subunit C-3 [Dendrobium catenatum]|uniref:Nuclear transcription factor Y subunit C-3 n=1 Tax=Dendrobium catenatum TaxID=906689 RepID=A0A2I0WGP6_9ASPA|nr:Nuclear transcription factor Y subunit C-3 [Dendrobium catenatum]
MISTSSSNNNNNNFKSSGSIRVMRSKKLAGDFKNHNLPLARIKKIMKANEALAAAAKETPVICERACEMFIQELTEKAWAHAQKSNRQTIEKRDIVAAAKETGHCDFLVDRKRKNHRGAHGASSSTAIPGDPLDPPEPRYHGNN